MRLGKRIGHDWDVKVCPVCQREYPAGATNCAADGVPLVAMVTDVYTRAEDLVGQIIEGRYKIERIIGKGGMGVVYACRHVVVGKIAAMKVLKAGVERSDGVLQRFVREAQTANLLKSRHIVEVSDFGQLPSGAFFVVMELLEGQDLAQAMRGTVVTMGGAQGPPQTPLANPAPARPPLNKAQLVHVFIQVAETLQLAHDQGIVHRDLKPDNVFLVNDSGDPLFVKLLDFGIAKILHGEGSGGLTETGVILGTPYYMSPEQARAEPIDHRTDIYALGVMMYRAFTGRLPFVADSTMGVLTRHITETPQPPSDIATVNQVTERLILRCLAKKPEYRFQSMRELSVALRSVPLEPVPAIREQSTVFEGPRAAPPAPSGAYPPASSGPYAAPSGAYPPALSGGYAAVSAAGVPHATSGAVAPPPGFAVVGVTPAAASTGTMTALHTPGGTAPVLPPGGEATTRGVSATSFPVAARSSNPLLVIAAGLGMAAVGAAGAFFLLYRPPVTVILPAAAASVAVPPAATTAPPPPAVSAPSPPAASGVASASAVATPTAATTPRRSGGGPARAAPPATPPAAPPKVPHGEIRSPFD